MRGICGAAPHAENEEATAPGADIAQQSNCSLTSLGVKLRDDLRRFLQMLVGITHKFIAPP